ncbi:unnamed protein product [Brassica rapa subsp. narinosa]
MLKVKRFTFPFLIFPNPNLLDPFVKPFALPLFVYLIQDQSIHPPELIEMAPGPDPNSVGYGAKRDEATTKIPFKDPKKKDDKKEEDLESLGYRLTGSEGDIGSWGHVYVRNLAGEIAEEYTVRQVRKQLFMSSLCLAFLCRMSLTYLDITDCYMLDRMPKRLGASVRTLGQNIGAKDTASRRLPEIFIILNLDEATVKEMRKKEEIAKAKLAMESKKKLAEKAVAKAAIRAQKEAEKKEQKEREKAAKKKTGGSNAYEAISEEVPEASEAEKEEIEAPVEEKPKKEKKVLEGETNKEQDPQ